MTKSSKKRRHSINRGPAPSDSPIYSSGYMLLRPIHGRKPEPDSDSEHNMKENLNAKQALEILVRVGSHNRTDKLAEIINQLDDEARKEALLFTWMATQAPSINWDFWYMNLPWAYAPITDDKAAFDALPEVITIYRGAGCEESAAVGFSWTMDREIAVKFAKLQTLSIGSGMLPRKEPGFIATRNIWKEQISMFVTERKESEVVILPDDSDFPVEEATIERVES